MKISDINKHNTDNTVNSLIAKESAKPPKQVQSDFALKLKGLNEDSLQEKLTTLLSGIDLQSRKIEKNFELGDILKYKKLVKEFLSLTVSNSHKFSKDNFLDRRGRHRVLSSIKEIDQELENLTKDFLDTEQDKLKIINRLDGIRGMLLDIFM